MSQQIAEKAVLQDPYDPVGLPDYDREFITPEELHTFEKALNVPEAFVAINDWRPINQRVRKTRGRRKNPKRSRDETREGVLYTLLKWPLLAFVLAWIAVLSCGYVLVRVYIVLYEQWVSWRGKRQQLRRALWDQKDYPSWLSAAKALDAYLGNDKWKETDEYAYYDHLTITKVLGQLKRARYETERELNSGTRAEEVPAIEEIRALLEACVKNNFAGVENPRLYSEAYSGTKDLVQEYIDEVHTCIQLVRDCREIDKEVKYQHFKHLDTNFGRTALCLSGGATFAYYHFGVVKALLDEGALPEIVTGTSGGSLIAGLVATRSDEELKQLLVPALAHRIRACSEGLTTWVPRWYRTGARFDTLDWARQCSWFCRGSTTFREAYERTGRILNVSCVPSDPHSPTILANYLTCPDCVIWSAVLASAAVPGILNPVVLMVKRDGKLQPFSFGHKWKDGSLRTDIPIRALNLHFNVNFTIVSQVNPHVNLFFFSSRGTVGRPVTHRKGRGWRGGFLGTAIEQYIKLDLNKWLRVLRHLELLPRPLGQDWSEIWLQKFSGTVTIWPKSIPSDFFYLLSDPSPERLARMINAGKQSTFPKIQFIKNRLKIENAIMRGLQQYSSTGGRSLSPILSRRMQAPELEPADALSQRLDASFPERHEDGDSRYVDDSMSHSTGSSRPQTPTRRGSLMEEIRRQSAVFFDDPDIYRDEDAVVT
ncbi:Patatin-like phospholipase domain-containing protein [Penicillium subrubescens]|uniref:Patatin-like phospholipase domain-containing protein n=1 Tax=Penicillium subrubescens TaxID=1316194 RepID=A0A1Q5UJ37_9EURO|nr:Patatin-like phospholipase domain-containing protein [Penicillium subrubescens]KAJ5911802.1 Patatin-like phospholipase domain-containing protein [Penicillium subrubescens]OKP12496.1 Patatin-like phospholipase domain-containing protein [Penicillium subrubescens]